MKAFSEAFADLKGTLSKEVQLQISEALVEIKERQDGQDNISDRLSTLESEIEVLKETVLEMQTKLEEKKDVENENEVLKKKVLEMQIKLEEKKDVETQIEVLKKTVLEIQMKLKENEVLEMQTQFETLGTNNATFAEQEQIQDSVWRANSLLWFWNKRKKVEITRALVKRSAFKDETPLYCYLF